MLSMETTRSLSLMFKRAMSGVRMNLIFLQSSTGVAPSRVFSYIQPGFLAQALRLNTITFDCVNKATYLLLSREAVREKAAIIDEFISLGNFDYGTDNQPFMQLACLCWVGV